MVMRFALSIELMKCEDETMPVADTLLAAACLLLGFAACVHGIDDLHAARFSAECNFDTP